jgi:tetratricopeptide (TPR) repeat protein
MSFGNWFCAGYLYFSRDAIRYEAVFPAKDKQHSFRYDRSNLAVQKEYYGFPRLEFKDGHKYTFMAWRRMILPSDDLLEAANNFDRELAEIQRRTERSAARGPVTNGSLDSILDEAGEIISVGATSQLRFAVAHAPTGKDAAFSYVSYGYLYFSRDSIRYEVAYGETGKSFNFVRTDFLQAKESFGQAELKFKQGSHKFTHYLPGPNPGKSFNLFAPGQEILEAVTSFDSALAKAKAFESDKVAVVSPIQRELLAAEENRGATSEQEGRLREALQHYLSALQRLPMRPPANLEQPLRERIIRLVLRLDPPPAVPEEAKRHATYSMVAVSHSTGPADLDDAIKEWDEALRVAPWWAEAYYNAALVLEKRERYADGAHYLQMYLLASPHAEDGQILQQKIYELEYLAKKQQTN